jgi:hypothetical protein
MSYPIFLNHYATRLQFHGIHCDVCHSLNAQNFWNIEAGVIQVTNCILKALDHPRNPWNISLLRYRVVV